MDGAVIISFDASNTDKTSVLRLRTALDIEGLIVPTSCGHDLQFD
jgi:hypothetical protein